MISAAAVTKRYASGLVALDAIDLTIEKGEIFALLGPNGAGKTTLIGVICGTVSMTSGKVLVDGHDIVSIRSRRATSPGTPGRLRARPKVPPPSTRIRPAVWQAGVVRTSRSSPARPAEGRTMSCRTALGRTVRCASCAAKLQDRM
jgi:ABC-type branched-subunit amino acid transport system ATPase component